MKFLVLAYLISSAHATVDVSQWFATPHDAYTYLWRDLCRWNPQTEWIQGVVVREENVGKEPAKFQVINCE